MSTDHFNGVERFEANLIQDNRPINIFDESGESLVEADFVNYMVALPDQLFYSEQMPVCLGFLAENSHGAKCRAVANDRINYARN